jgi:hypothetical protein
LKIFENTFHGGLGRSLDIGIFNPENEDSPMAFCKDIIEKGSSSVSDMEKTGWGWCKAYPNIWIHLKPLTTVNFEAQVILVIELFGH